MSILESDRSLLIRALHAVGYEDDILVDQPIRPDGYNTASHHIHLWAIVKLR